MKKIIADKIYALLKKADPRYEDAIASLELVKVWILMDLLESD